jgi:hypothetical protein
LVNSKKGNKFMGRKIPAKFEYVPGFLRYVKKWFMNF